MIAVVTAFVPIPNHPRPEVEYRKLGERLLNAKIDHAGCMYQEAKISECWLYRHLEFRGQSFRHSISDNPRKNTPEYHIVQSQKSEFLSDAARHHPEAEIFVWIDYGIFHLRGMSEKILSDFLKRIEGEQAVTIPGCWSTPFKYDDDHPCWRFCGGVMIVPRRYVIEFDVMMKAEYIRWLQLTNNLSWEVNCLARMEQRGFPIWWYKADHDHTMFSNYQASHVKQGSKETASSQGH